MEHSGAKDRNYNLHTMAWSPAEKRIARKAFEGALQRELDEIIAEVKQRAEQMKTPADLWKLDDFLSERRKEIDRKYDFRYSQLPIVFATLVQEGRMSPADLDGLAHNKLGYVRLVLENRSNVAGE